MDSVPPHLLRALEHALLLRLLFFLRPSATPHRGPVVSRVEQEVQIVTSALARDVRVVRRRDEADRLGRAPVEVARRVRALLDGVRAQPVLVVHDSVVRRLHVSLQSIVRL